MRERLIEYLLTECVDGDFLIGCSRSAPGEDVAVQDARVSEVAGWAADGARAWLMGELRRPEMLLAIARAVHGNTIGDPAKGEPLVRVQRSTVDLVEDAQAALSCVFDRLGLGVADA